MDLNKTIIVGRATRDADVRTTTNGAKVAGFTVASDALNEHTNFIPVVCWNKKADFAERFVRKGEKFAISGRLNQRQYENKDKVKVTLFEIICEDIYFWGSKSDKPRGDVVVEDFDDSKPFPIEEIPFN